MMSGWIPGPTLFVTALQILMRWVDYRICKFHFILKINGGEYLGIHKFHVYLNPIKPLACGPFYECFAVVFEHQILFRSLRFMGQYLLDACHSVRVGLLRIPLTDHMRRNCSRQNKKV